MATHYTCGVTHFFFLCFNHLSEVLLASAAQAFFELLLSSSGES